MKKKEKLFAFVHDGSFDGDSAFWFPSFPIPYKAGMTLNDLKEGHILVETAKSVESGATPEDIVLDTADLRADFLLEVVGAVVVTEKTIDAMSAVWESEPGNDSAAYSCNRASKRIAWSLKKAVVGKGMK